MFVLGMCLLIFWILVYLVNACTAMKWYTVKDYIKSRGCLKMEEKKLEVLLNEYEELRNELKQRISQRDNFSVQFVVACCAVLALTASMADKYLIMLLPLITIFFATQIFESYKVHERLVEFIRDTLEEKISNQIGEDFKDCLWETHCKHIRELMLDQNVGGRKRFFSGCARDYAGVFTHNPFKFVRI